MRRGGFSVEIIATGDEILFGRILDTNSNWMARRLADLGAHLRRVTCVGDEVDEIAAALGEAMGRGSRLILFTGGLGPSEDDMTVDAIGAAVGRGVVLDPSGIERIRRSYSERHMEFSDRAARMARVVEGSKPGSAWAPARVPAMEVEEGETTVVVSLERSAAARRLPSELTIIATDPQGRPVSRAVVTIDGLKKGETNASGSLLYAGRRAGSTIVVGIATLQGEVTALTQGGLYRRDTGFSRSVQDQAGHLTTLEKDLECVRRDIKVLGKRRHRLSGDNGEGHLRLCWSLLFVRRRLPRVFAIEDFKVWLHWHSVATYAHSNAK